MENIIWEVRNLATRCNFNLAHMKLVKKQTRLSETVSCIVIFKNGKSWNNHANVVNDHTEV